MAVLSSVKLLSKTSKTNINEVISDSSGTSLLFLGGKNTLNALKLPPPSLTGISA